MAEKVKKSRIASGKEAPRTDERSKSGQSTRPGVEERSKSGQSTRPGVEERSQSRQSSRPGSGDTHLATNPGEIIEDPEKPSAQQYNTFVDTRPPEDDHESSSPTVSDNPRESMAAQDEIAFPTTIETTSTPEPKERYVDNEPVADKESLNPADYGVDMEDEVEPVYEPPENDDTLPDLYRLMASLDAGIPPEDSPTNQNEPPSLFSRPENIDNYKTITDLRLQIEEADIEDYIRGFERGVKDDVLMIGSIGLEDVQEEERRLRDEHVNYLESEALWEEDRKRRIRMFEEQAKRRAAYAVWQKRKEIQRMDQLQQQKERLMLDRLQRSFRRSENQLITELKRRRGEVMTYYGDLMTADGHYGGSRGRRWKVDWDRTPQPIQVKLTCLRGVKDKIPGGRYVLIVSLYNRLGGHVMRWSNLKGQQWGGATLPMRHDGHFYNMEMQFDQSVFTVLPARPGVKPGMILVFELFLLRGEVLSSDRVVAWGTFPIADGQFDIIEGKFKVPMLRGEMDHRVEKHEKLESLLASDLDHWMCNLYFEIVKLPRFLAGQKEYEVELQFSSGILAYPDRVNTDEAMHDGEEPVAGSLPDLYTDTTANTSRIASDVTVGSAVSSINGRSMKKPHLNDSLDSVAKPPLDSSIDDIQKYKHDSMADLKERVKQKDVGVRQRRPYSTIGSRGVQRQRKIKICNESDSDDADDTHLMKKDKEYFPVHGKQGLFYKKHKYGPLDLYQKKLFTLLPETPLMKRQQRKRRRLTHLERLEAHSYSVSKEDDVWKLLNEKGRIPQQANKKVQYVSRQLMAELGLSQWRSREFWGMLFMFILVFFIRIYIHYISQWVLLQALELPVNKFNFLPYTVELNYQATLLTTREEIGLVLLGPCGNILLFIILVLASFIIQKAVGMFPEVGSKLVISYGIQAFLDPFLILIVDCALKRYKNQTGTDPIADSAKLYWHFYRAEGTGLAGIFITIFLYVFTCFMAGAILYMYFLRLHNNGRMLDIYWRLHGDEDIFFVPYDLEVSHQELAYIVKKAEQWRGEEGERRKVAVYDYVWEEEQVEETVWDEDGAEVTRTKDSKKEITTHVAIHTLHLDGLRELYRHFLRLPDGAIIEVFGDMAVAGMNKDINDALSKGAKQLEQLDGSEPLTSQNGVRFNEDNPTSSTSADIE